MRSWNVGDHLVLTQILTHLFIYLLSQLSWESSAVLLHTWTLNNMLLINVILGQCFIYSITKARRNPSVHPSRIVNEKQFFIICSAFATSLSWNEVYTSQVLHGTSEWLGTFTLHSPWHKIRSTAHHYSAPHAFDGPQHTVAFTKHRFAPSLMLMLM